MVAHVLRLRLAMMLGALRGDRDHVLRRAVGLFVLVAGTVFATINVAALADSDRLTTSVVTVLAGSAVTLGFAIAPPL
ncbi:hypothetical protein ACO1MK_14880, partial [Staphylococcus aureus]